MSIFDFFRKRKKKNKNKEVNINPATMPKYMMLKNRDKISEDNEFFKNLDLDYQIFFDNLDYIPSSKKEANDFVRSTYELDNIKDFTVNFDKLILIDGKAVRSVDIKKSQPFYAVVPAVWEKLNAKERLHSVVMMYNYLVNEQSVKIQTKPQLIFFFNDEISLENYGKYDSEDNTIYVSLFHILSDKSDGLNTLNTLAH